MEDLLIQAQTTPTQWHDGGRHAAGLKGKAGDCVLRATVIALTSGAPTSSPFTKAAYVAIRDSLATVQQIEIARRTRFLERKLVRKGLPVHQQRELKTLRNMPKRSALRGIYKKSWDKFAAQAHINKIPMNGERPTVAQAVACYERIIIGIRGHKFAAVGGTVYDSWKDRDELLWYDHEEFGTNPRKALNLWEPTPQSDEWLQAQIEATNV